jgi:YjbR
VADDLVARVRAICLAFPEVTERPSHSAPTWFVKDKRAFVTLWADGHHDNHFPHLWCASVLEEQQELIAADPARFFRPPYVGHRGWVGVRLDTGPDWAEIAELCQDAYQVIARLARGAGRSGLAGPAWPGRTRRRPLPPRR